MKKYYHVITERNDEYISTVAIAENIETVKARFAGQNVREIIELNAAQVNTISARPQRPLLTLPQDSTRLSPPKRSNALTSTPPHLRTAR